MDSRENKQPSSPVMLFKGSNNFSSGNCLLLIQHSVTTNPRHCHALDSTDRCTKANHVTIAAKSYMQNEHIKWVITEHIYPHQYAICSSLRRLLTRPPHCRQTKLLPSANASNMICFLPVMESMDVSSESSKIGVGLAVCGGGGGERLFATIGCASAIAHSANSEANSSTAVFACSRLRYSSRARCRVSRTACSPPPDLIATSTYMFDKSKF